MMPKFISFSNSTPKTPIRRTDLGDTSYTSWVTAYYVSYFVAVATGPVVVKFF